MVVAPGLVCAAMAQGTAAPTGSPSSARPGSAAAVVQPSNAQSSGQGGSVQSSPISTNPDTQAIPPEALGPSTNPPPPWPTPQPVASPAQAGSQGTSPRSTSQAGAKGEPPSASDNGIYVFQAEAREVVLHATVVDDKDRLVTTLDKSDFQVFENGQPQKIELFRREDYPVAMGILIDNSGSMREKRDEVNKAALNLVRSSNPNDQVFVVNFSDEPILDQEFTSDIKKLQAALEHVEARGGTAIYDAVVAASDYLMKSPLQRKVLFVVTDGDDDASQESLEETVQRLQQENGPAVYTIGLLSGGKNRRAKRALEIMAERTGGTAFFPPTLLDVDEISRSIAHDIRNQYTIAYDPTTPKSVGGYRTIRVEARARGYKKLMVRTRSGYYPGQQRSMK
jgi:Ca-activated chloride channel homolog